MRKMGGLRKLHSVDLLDDDLGTFAIAGIPPLAGFFSKDEILWQAYQPSRQRLLAHRPYHRLHDLVLHVPAVVPDVLRRVSRRAAMA